MQASCAGSHGSHIGAFEVEQNAQMPRNHVDDGARNKEGGNSAWATGKQFSTRVFDHGQTANAGTHHDANTLGIFFGDFDTTVSNRLRASSNAVMDKGIHVARFFSRDVLFYIEVFHFARKMNAQRGVIKLGNGGNAAFATHDASPCSVN